MSSASRLAPVALALLLVLAGCGGSPGSGTPANDSTVTTTTPGSQYDVTVENGTLPVDANRTYARVTSLMGTEVDPRTVEIRNFSEWRGSLPRVAASPLNDSLGYENVSADWNESTGLTLESGYVYLHPGEGSPDEIERVLAHEFAHSVQFQANMFPWLDRWETQGTRPTIDEAKVYRSLQEGGAVYVADAYTERYLDGQTDSAVAREQMAESPTHWSALAPYHFGSRYVADRIDSPANLSAVYEDRPATTEQLIHNYTRAEEPPAALAVETNATGSSWEYEGNNTLGELTTRGALGTELNRSRAAAAAAGWGTDELAVFSAVTSDDRFSWVWVHRWDDASEADEAAAALEAYADRRDESGQYDFAFTRVDAETTALTFGEPAFVANATVSGTSENVSVAVDA